MPIHQSAASAINLVDEENEKVPRPVEAEALPSNVMDDAVMRVIAMVEQTLGAWGFSAADQDRHVSAERLQLAAQHDRWRAAEQGLAPVVIRDIYAALPRIRAGGAAIVLVEQDIGKALSVADRVYCMMEGRVTLTANAAEVSRQQIHAAYFGEAA
jgi:ABC-type lipopolysaccharide export system ATPase subunit